MSDLQAPDAESLRLELQEAIVTLRHQLALLTQAFGIVVTADAALVAYGFAQRKSGILLVASLLPLFLLMLFFEVMTNLTPVVYVATRLEHKLSLHGEPLIRTLVLVRDDIPPASSEVIGKLSDPKLRRSMWWTLSWHVLKSRKSAALLYMFIIQFSIFWITLAVYHYRFM
jgi:hypothetical protein